MELPNESKYECLQMYINLLKDSKQWPKVPSQQCECKDYEMRMAKQDTVRRPEVTYDFRFRFSVYFRPRRRHLTSYIEQEKDLVAMNCSIEVVVKYYFRFRYYYCRFRRFVRGANRNHLGTQQRTLVAVRPLLREAPEIREKQTYVSFIPFFAFGFWSLLATKL